MKRFIVEVQNNPDLDVHTVKEAIARHLGIDDSNVSVTGTALATDDIVEAARERHCDGSDNEIEIDEPANSSHGEDGVWVQAWVFVPGMGDEYVDPDYMGDGAEG